MMATTYPDLMRRSFVLVAVALLAYGACGDGDDSGSASPTASSQPPHNPPELRLDGSVTLYAAEAGDKAAALAAGDFNGDGFTDVVLGAAFADGPDNTREDAGEILLFAGPMAPGEVRDAAFGDHDAVIYGAETGDQAGRTLAAADVNADGIDDIVIGVPFGDGPDNTRKDAGEAVVILGSKDLGNAIDTIDLREGADFTLYGPEEGALTGFSLAAGHINDDPFADLIIGSFRATGPRGLTKAGAVHAVFGSSDPIESIDTADQSADITVYGPIEDGWLGESVGVGDFNGDGLDDLLLPTTFAPTFAGDDAGGRVSILLSPIPPLVDLSTSVADYTIYGADAGDQLGHSNATGDVDGDGVDDILLGAVSSSGSDNNFELAGEAALILGSSLQAGIDVGAGEQSSIAYGPAKIDRLGRSVALGDVDGDGLADILLGAPGGESIASRSSEAGALYLISGNASLSTEIDLSNDGNAFFGNDSGDGLADGVDGRPALITADIDGDGRAEILVSASDGDGPANDRAGAGEALILFVSPSQTP